MQTTHTANPYGPSEVWADHLMRCRAPALVAPKARTLLSDLLHMPAREAVSRKFVKISVVPFPFLNVHDPYFLDTCIRCVYNGTQMVPCFSKEDKCDRTG